MSIHNAVNEERSQHERFVQKLREAEMEETYREETVSQAALDEAMDRIFAAWGETSA